MSTGAILEITDGTAANTVSLISIGDGIAVKSWLPSSPVEKGSAVISDSPISSGTFPVFSVLGSVTENMDVVVSGTDADRVAYHVNKLRQILRNARLYWENPLANVSPYYIRMRAPNETNIRYGLLLYGSFPMDGVVLQSPFTQVNCFSPSSMDETPLTLTHLGWESQIPTQSEAFAIYAKYDHLTKTFGNVDTDGDIQATTDADTVFTAMASSQGLTHIWVNDGGAFGSNLLTNSVGGYDLLPAVPAVGDYVVFMCDDTDGETIFHSLSIPLQTAGAGYGGTWEATDGVGGWTAIGASNSVTSGADDLDHSGESLYTFNLNTGTIAPDTVNGTNGFAIRYRVTSVTTPTPPTVTDYRDPYIVKNDFFTVPTQNAPRGLNISLDFTNLEDGAIFDRFVIGARSQSRGTGFRSTLWLNGTNYDEYGPNGDEIETSTGTSDYNYSSGYSGWVNSTTLPSNGNETFATTFNLLNALDYHGNFRIFAYVSTNDSTPSDTKIRLYNNGIKGDWKAFNDTGGTWQVVDLGEFFIDARTGSVDTQARKYGLLVYGRTDNGVSTATLKVMALRLIPVDEMFIDAVSVVAGAGSSPVYDVAIDNRVEPRLGARAWFHQALGGVVTLSSQAFDVIAPNGMVVPNGNVNVYVLMIGDSGTYNTTKTCSVTIKGAKRYYTLRGDN